MKIRILPDAIEDLNTGRLFYERIAAGIGDYFFDSLFADIDSLILYAGIHPKFFGYHRMLCKRFPFAVYYRIDEETVLVFRVLDLRQNPDAIRKKIAGEE